MAKIDLNEVKSGFNLSKINDNFQKIASVINERILFRNNVEGEPNQMHNDLDMNGKRIYNLPEPIADNEPARKQDVDEIKNAASSKKTVRVSDVDIPALPDAVNRRNKILSFDNNGNPQVLFPSDDSATQLRIDLSQDDGYTLVGGLSNGVLLKFNSYEELRNHNGTESHVEVVGDKISGIFERVNSGTENYGTLIVSHNGTKWKRLTQGVINAGWFESTTALQLALEAAGTHGTVFIPQDYNGTDSYRNIFDIQIIDHRKLGTVAKHGVHSVIAPSESEELYPLGHDLVLRSCGPADTYIEHVNATCTTDTPLNVGVNNNVLISEVRIGSALRGVLRTTDSSCLSEYGGFWVNRDEPDEEYIGPENYSIVDGNHINITCSKSHSGKTYIEQCGSTLLASRDLFISAHSVKSEKSTGFNPPVNVKDLHGDLVFTWPSDLGSPFPHSAFAIAPIMTGANGPEKHMFYQHRQADSRIYWRNNINEIIASFNNAGQMEYRSGGVSIGGPSVTNGVDGVIQIGRASFSTTVPASDSDAFIEWSQSGYNSMNPQGGAGNLLLYSSAIGNSEIVLGTQKVPRIRASQHGIGFNGADPRKPSITGSVSGNTALSSLILALSDMGLVINNTTY